MSLGSELRLDCPRPDLARLRAVEEVTGAERDGPLARIFVPNAVRALAPIAAVLADQGEELAGLEIHPVTLERVFMRLTGKALRD